MTDKTLIIHPTDKSTDFLKVVYAGRDDVTVINSGTKEEVKEAIKTHNHIVMMGHGTPSGLLGVNQFNKKAPVLTPQRIVTGAPVTSSSFNKPTLSAKTAGKITSDRGVVTKAELDKEIDDWLIDYEGSLVAHQSSGVGKTKQHVNPSYERYGNYGGGFSESYVKEMTTGYVIDDGDVDLLDGKKLTSIWCNADQFMEWNELDGFYTGMFISEVGEAKIIGYTTAEQWQVDESNYAFVRIVRDNIDRSSADLYRAVKNEYGRLAQYNPVAKYNYLRCFLSEGKSYSSTKDWVSMVGLKDKGIEGA